MLLYGLLLSAYMVAVVLGEEYYCKFSPKHTLCRFQGVSNKCGKVFTRGVSEKEQWRIVDYHNKLRSMVATGATPQPPAANMMEMEWDEELAAIAQRHADQCKFEHDCPDCRKVSRFSVGQNLFVSYGNIRDGTDWKQPMEAWFDEEIRDFPSSHISPFKYVQKAGHFSQLAWATTTKVGCGLTTYTHGKFVGRMYVCNYGKAGNMIGGSMYSIGQGCSACPENTHCSSDYPGICTYDTFVPRI